MSGYPHLHYQVEDGVAVLRLDRPERLNALTSAIADEQLPELCRRATDDPAVRVVVLTGTGQGFCAGADLGERISAITERADTAALRRPLGAFVLAVWDIPKPVIAAVNGVAAGGGMSLAAVADLRVVAESARFVPAFAVRSLMADGGLTQTLPALVGRSRATEILLTGREVGAAEAMALGLADMVVPDADLMRETGALAARIAAGAPLAMSFTKRALQRSHTNDLPAQLEFESWGQRVCLNSQDFAEGREAFVAGRTPVFEGR